MDSSQIHKSIHELIHKLIHEAEGYEEAGDIEKAAAKYLDVVILLNDKDPRGDLCNDISVKVAEYYMELEEYSDAFVLLDDTIRFVKLTTDNTTHIKRWMVLSGITQILEDGYGMKFIEKKIKDYQEIVLSFGDADPYYELISGILKCYDNNDSDSLTRVCQKYQDILDPVLVNLLLQIKLKIQKD